MPVKNLYSPGDFKGQYNLNIILKLRILFILNWLH